MEFGNTSDSQVLAAAADGSGSLSMARAWAVNKISDAASNYFTVTYNSAAGTDRTIHGEVYPVEIDYTGNASASVSPYNSVQFSYAARTDMVALYQAGAVTQTTGVLSEIKTYQAANLVYDYKLAYRAGTTVSHSRLTSVTLCDAGGGCLPATTFGWQGGDPHLNINSTAGFGQQTGIAAAPGDWDGDGIIDELVYDPLACPSYNVWLGPLMTSIGTTLTNGAAGHAPCIASGAQTILAPNGTTSFLLTAAGTFSSAPTGRWFYDFFNTAGSINLASYTPSPGTNLSPLPGDFNGDGVPDFLQEGASTSYIWYGNPPSAASFTQDGGHSLGSNQTFLSPADFDGDGCADIYQHPFPGYPSATNALYYSFACNPAVSTATALPSNMDTYFSTFGDFNGDGKTDVLLTSRSGTGGQLWLSTGTKFVQSGYTVPSGWGGTDYTFSVGDWNGDGKADLLLVSQNNDGSHPSRVFLSTGDGFTEALDGGGSPITIANSAGALGAIVADWNNDGNSDFIIQDGSSDTLYNFDYAPELMTSVSNGIGATTFITYDRLNQNGSFYQKCPTPGDYTCGTYPSPSYPSQYQDGPIYVVKHVDASNGLGTCNPGVNYCYTTTYAYAEAQSDLKGRGFLGFSRVAITDTQTNIVQTTNYCTLFPLTGLVSEQTRVDGGTTLSDITNSYNSVSGCGATGTGGSVNTVNLSESVSVSNDLNGAAFPTVTTNYTYDGYGNALTVNVSVAGGSTKDTTNTYESPDLTNWFIGQLATTQVHSVVGASDMTRQSSFAYDNTTGLLTEEDIEPGISTCNGNGSSCELLTSYTYDAFGHRITTTISGTGITTRTSYAFYDSNGEFQTSAANALGQYEFWTYDARFGAPVSHTGPNFLTTNWTYDSFGRMLSESRPDGTQTALSNAYCSGSCPTYGQFYAQSQIFGTNGLQAGATSSAYFDMLSRAIANDNQGFDGSNVRVATVYDGNGRIQETSRPYFTSGGTAKYTSFAYDDLGRVTQATFPDSSQTTYVFNGLVTTVTNNLSQVTNTTKNAQGLNASVQDDAGHTTSYVYDAFGDLLTVTDPASNVVTNTYDIRGNKIVSTDPDMNTWHYGYDVLGELIAQVDAKSQTTVLDYDLLGRPLDRTETGLYSVWTYGTSASAHNIGKLAEAKACTNSGCSSVVTDKKFSYDSLTRPSMTILVTGGNSYAYGEKYNPINGQLALTGYPSGFILNHLYNQYGYLCRLAEFNFDYATCSTNAANSRVFVTVDARDAEMHLTQSTAGNGVVTTETFDANTGLIETQRAGSSGAVASFDYAFDTIGNLTSRADNNESFTERFCYDSLNRLTNSNMGAACSGGKSVSYDAIGNITAKSDAGSYAYVGGAHAVTAITGTVDGLTNPQYSYDFNGNMICVSTGSACSGTVARQVAMTGFNMVSGLEQGTVSLSFAYDDQHARVAQISADTSNNTSTQTTYLNDPASGAMAIMTITGTTVATRWNSFHWDLDPWGGTLPSGTPTWTDYISLDGKIVAQRVVQYDPAYSWGSGLWDSMHWDGITTTTTWDNFHWDADPWTGNLPGGRWDSFHWDGAVWGGLAAVSYFALDHLGSVAVVTDDTGHVAERLSYDPWGKQRNANGTDIACGTIQSSTTRGFTNQEELPAQCVVNLNARLYDASIGRFMAADSIVPDPFNGQSFNRYSYVNNSPLSFTDPSGHGCGDDWFCRISGGDPGYCCDPALEDTYGNRSDKISERGATPKSAEGQYNAPGSPAAESASGIDGISITPENRSAFGAINNASGQDTSANANAQGANWSAYNVLKASDLPEMVFDPVFTGKIPHESAWYRPASIMVGVASIASEAAEYGSGNTTFGLNLNNLLKSRSYTNGWIGNQSVRSFSIARIGGRASEKLGPIGLGLDFYGFATADSNYERARKSMDMTVGFLGLLGGPGIAVFSGIYFLENAGGDPGKIYGDFAKKYQEVNPTWRPFDPISYRAGDWKRHSPSKGGPKRNETAEFHILELNFDQRCMLLSSGTAPMFLTCVQ